MFKLAKVLTGITMVLLVFLLIALYGVYLQVELAEFSAQPASERAELATELIGTARRDDMGSDLFARPTSNQLENYNLITIQVRAKNVGILPAEWVQLRLAPEIGDVALFPGDASDVRPLGGQITITATLLSESHTQQDRRDIRLEYYIFGRRMEVAVY